jgi:hypothetical protein
MEEEQVNTGKEEEASLELPAIEWNDAIETLIKEQGEKALSYTWLHTKCEKKYSYANNFIALPVICLSTLAGSASIASNQLGDSKYIPLGIGALSIIVGILSTINSYFSWAKRAENHRISALNYSKLYLFISIELSLPREKRMNPRDFIKVIREQIERLGEISPPIADDIIKEFRTEFDGKYENVSKPEITNGLVSIRVYKEPEPLVKEKAVQTEPDLPDSLKDFTLDEATAVNALPSVEEEKNGSLSESNDDDDSIDTLKTITPLSRKMTKKSAWR